ncbi:1,3-beta-glucan synthase component domain-containing protein, putative [Eimeria tenella]|uniref:1,3-beta-glucan synthase n=1 Tax=Eimeria tenella TaxID=5802 RepID=U6KRW7_EIMTE|nr:1,3-beta-glucan synthase component domain-containing protein, putative [Eimeria tenella]CDJ39099.1 1,3-beta-glucan synthase component domain-containing protein, putative [Eimeria tenella]|eukprot:XP_013229854.1 1,3-beta-glucan synthase component domain-containing protein, putative [Eimeria tenella]
MDQLKQPREGGAWVGGNEVRDQLVKSNILYIDGRNLLQSRVLDYHPLGRSSSEASQASDGISSSANSGSSLSRHKTVPRTAHHQPPYTIEQTIWYVAKRQYRFQTDTMYNQLEDVCVSILNLALMEAPPGSPFLGPEVLFASLDEYHSRLFANYYKWCDYVGTAPFPWRCPPWLEDSYCSEDTNLKKVKTDCAEEDSESICSPRTRQELQQMMFEVATFKLLWAEAANLRHTPELLCWLFHWLCAAWDKDFRPEEDFIDLIRDAIQRIRDEQWYMATSLHTPDHNARLIYDDFNELFWSRRCLDILEQRAKDTGTTEQGLKSKAQFAHPQADTRSFSDSFLRSDARPKDEKPRRMGLSVSRENLNAVIAELSCSSKPGSGVKTFVEHRTYAQVLRNFWRVFAWHVTTFAGILLLYAVVDEESSYSVSKQWSILTLTAILSYGMLPVLDLLLVNYRKLVEPQYWKLTWRRIPLHLVRVTFAVAALVTVSLDGLDSAFLYWKVRGFGLHSPFPVKYLRHAFSGDAVAQYFAATPAENDFQRPSAQYTNNSDPYAKMVPMLAAKIMTQAEEPRERSTRENHDEAVMKRFGFLWNEIIQSWRDEDIINFAEQEKLEFNELPRILLETNSLSDLYLGRGDAMADWSRSAVRHPVYVYCNELANFLKSCEDFHYQASGDMLRLCSKQSLAKTFYREYLSNDPNNKDPRFETSTHLQACHEIAEAFILYLARYFRDGSQLVWAMEELWSWVSKDHSRLLWLNLQGLKALSNALHGVFVLIQRASFWAPSDADKLAKANAQLKKALLAMIMLPSTEPEELGESNIPLVVQDYVKAVSVCFGSDSWVKDIPSILPSPIQRAEVAVMIEQLEVLLQHTSSLLLSNEGEKDAMNTEDLPLLPEELAEMRALHAQLGEANANVVLGDNGVQDGCFFSREPADSSRIASVEHAVRLFFRRAARILKAEDPSFKCAETQRRFGTFVNSLLMRIPETPLVRNMVSMMTLTPYYREDTRLDLQDLEKRTDEGVCKMDLLRSLHPVEFDNFIERVDRDRDMFTIRQEIEDRVTDSPERRNLALQDIRAQMQQCGLLHRDTNRLDETQLDIIRSPEGALWREVVNFAPPYETKQSTRELAQLKYQYVVAAQEFGTDLNAQMPTNGCEPSLSLRAQLLRKVALYKLLVRYPTLRIATLEHERTPDGRPTGHKLSVLYRLTADVDPIGEQITTPAAASPTELRAAGRFVRLADGEVVPAQVPKLLVPAPRIPVCMPGANMGPDSTVTIKTRSGGNSSEGGRSGEVVSIHSSKTPASPFRAHAAGAGTAASKGICHNGAALQDNTKKLQTKSIRNHLSIIEGTRQLLKQGFTLNEMDSPSFCGSKDKDCDKNVTLGHAASPADSGAQANSRQSLPLHAHSRRTGVGNNGGAGDFESKIARAIHWLHKKKQCDRSLFAARTKTTFQYTASSPLASGESDPKNTLSLPRHEMTDEPQRSSLPMLRRGMPYGLAPDALETAQAVTTPLQNSNRLDTLQENADDADLSQHLHSQGLQGEAQLHPAPVHNATPHTFMGHGQTNWNFSSASGEWEDCENKSTSVPLRNSRHARPSSSRRKIWGTWTKKSSSTVRPCQAPTLLESQFARALALDLLNPVTSTADADRHPPASILHGLRPAVDGSSRQSTLQFNPDEHDSTDPRKPLTRRQMSRVRRYSIITLHPGQNGTQARKELQTLDLHHWECGWDSTASRVGGDTLVGSRINASNANCVELINPQPRQFVHRQDPCHRAEFQASPRTVASSSAVTSLNLHEGRMHQRPENLGTSERGFETRVNYSSTAAHRSNSVGALRERGILTMKERVAFFEDKLSRHQAHMEAEAQRVATKQRDSHRGGMIWPSRRGPLRLEAIYKIRLPLIVDESGMPWGRTPIIGPGKPENQNHAIAFSRMETMQVMDMNMESYLEEAIKLRNLLQEFALNARMRILARGYCVHHADYIQCGKGRDVGLQQVVMFEKKVAGGNGEQVLSRDLYRLVSNMDFFRVLSLWFTGPGFFLNSVILVLAAYVCLYTKCFLAFAKYNYSGPVESALEYVLTPSTYIQFQLGMLLVLPLVPWLFLEKGFGSALRKLLDLMSKFSVTYYNFMTCTKASIIDHVLIYGGAKYQETGRGFVIERATLKDIWMFFYFTHFSVGLEMFVLLIIYATYAGLDAGVFFLDTWPIFLMAASINSVPFIFNPLGFYYPRLRQDFTSWNAWLSSHELGMPKESWVSWWREEMEQRCNIVWHHKLIIVLRLLRFPLLAAGIISCVATSIQSADVDCAVYLVAASGLFASIKALLRELQTVSPSIKAWLSLLLVAGTSILVLWLVITGKVSLGSLVISFFALGLFVYGALEMAFALLDRWAVRSDMLSDVIRMYHRFAGFCIFAPLLVLSAITTSVHHLQTRILFNPTFVSIVKSGLVQREQVEKSGRGHS